VEQTPTLRREIEAHLIARALRDDEFRRLLIAEPREALESELKRLQLNINLPSTLKVKVIEETSDTLYLVLPPDLTAVDGASDGYFLDAIRGLNLNGK
jgi:hypothetical protein